LVSLLAHLRPPRRLANTCGFRQVGTLPLCDGVSLKDLSIDYLSCRGSNRRRLLRCALLQRPHCSSPLAWSRHHAQGGRGSGVTRGTAVWRSHGKSRHHPGRHRPKALMPARSRGFGNGFERLFRNGVRRRERWRKSLAPGHSLALALDRRIHRETGTGGCSKR
jgi:hypothetical protein